MRDSGQRNIKRPNVRVSKCVYVYACVRERQKDMHTQRQRRVSQKKVDFQTSIVLRKNKKKHP